MAKKVTMENKKNLLAISNLKILWLIFFNIKIATNRENPNESLKDNHSKEV